MAKALNFNTVKKQYLPVTFADSKKTTIFVGTPTKAVMSEIIDMESSLEDIRNNEANGETIDRLYDISAKIMSRNKGGVKITTEYLAENFDFEDIFIFFSAYVDFVTEITDAKN